MLRTRLLLVWHSRTGLARQMADALEAGAHAAAEEMEADSFSVVRRRAQDATVEDVLSAHGYIFCAPENLASTSGEMLEFFHRTYYHAFAVDEEAAAGGDYAEASRLLGRPCAVAVAAGSDGRSAAAQMERICQGWRLKPVAPALVHRNGLVQTKENILAAKECPPGLREQCVELGGLVAATALLAEG